MANAILTAQRLRDALDYNGSTGQFTRRLRTAQRHHVGDRADFLITSGGCKGYLRVTIDSIRYLAHRLAWFHAYGVWPLHEIDHINGNPADNRIMNLRDVLGRINIQNMRRPRINNKCGYLGVSAHQGKWRSRIQIEGKVIEIGSFNTPLDAHLAYLIAKRKIHEGCTI